MSALRALLVSSIALSFTVVSVPTLATYASLQAQMAQGCPVAWEDLAVAINSHLPTGDLWAGDTADRDAFVAIYTSENPGLTPAQVQSAADDLTTVARECASFRLAVLDELLSQTSMDIDAATSEAGDTNLLALMQDRFLTGDVRVTGRPTADEGWVFLVGQTIGNTGSGADLSGPEYEALFNLAKTWAPNTGSEDFNAGGQVQLPDMRGRGLFGADNMGGVAAGTLTGADTVGSSVGSQSQTLTEAQLPSHNHTMQGAGEHVHTLTAAGSHQHKVRTSIYTGSSSGSSTEPYFEGKARPNYQNTIQEDAVRPAGSHAHGMSNPGNHVHEINATGGGQPVTTVSPGVVFNVEMKL